MRPELTLLVPARDERANLAAHLPLMAAAAARCTPRWEMLVVDDGSRDRTAALVRRRARRDGRIRLVQHPRALGPGAGLPTGLFWARGRWVLFLPADLGCEPAGIERMWRARRGADVVVGLRSDRSDSGPWRRLLSHGYIGLVQALSGSPIRQFNYIQLWRRAIFARLPVYARGVFVTAEIILRAEAAGLRLVEQELRYRPRRRGRAAGASPPALARCAVELARFFALESNLRLTGGRARTP